MAETLDAFRNGSFVKLRLSDIQSVNRRKITFPTPALGYSHSKEACDHEEPVRSDGGEPGKDPAGKIGAPE
jgi:hypothetical protein